MRVHLACRRMSLREADILEYYLKNVPGVTAVKVFDRTQDAIITYQTDRTALIRALAAFSFASEQAIALVPEHTSRQLNREYEDKLVFTVCRRAFSWLFLPYPITTAIALFRSVKYIKEGLKALWHGKLSVAVLDATAVTVSMLRGDFNTAGSVMFMLRLGEILEEWTHKKSVADLAGAMALNVDKVWLQSGETELLVPIGDVRPGDRMIVRTGNLIPLDGKVVSGEATVNQASITGESLPVAKRAGSYVYAGTVIEEGECVVSVEKALGGGRYDRIVRMIEESEKLKSTAEDKASRLADRLVPWTLGGTALTYLLTRNVTKMLAVLMVDFSCALKLSMPIAVLSAMRESSSYHISVKGGRFLEAVSKADTVVFDKTGTRRSSPSAVTRPLKCCGWPRAWRSITRTRWPTPSSTRPSGRISSTRNTTRRCSMSSRTASPAWSRAKRSSSAARISSLKTRAVPSPPPSRRNSTRSTRSIPICICASRASWPRSSASPIRCAPRRRTPSVPCTPAASARSS